MTTTTLLPPLVENDLAQFVPPPHLQFRSVATASSSSSDGTCRQDLDLLAYFCAHSTAVNYRDAKFSIQAQPAVAAKLEAKQRLYPIFNVNQKFQDFITHCTSREEHPVLTRRSLDTLGRLYLNIEYDPPGDGSCLFGSVVRACYGDKATASLEQVVAHVRMLKREIINAFLKKLDSHTTAMTADNSEMMTTAAEEDASSHFLSLDDQLSLIHQFGKLEYYSAPLEEVTTQLTTIPAIDSNGTFTDSATSSETISPPPTAVKEMSDDAKRAAIRQFIAFLTHPTRGYLAQQVFGDEMDAQLLADLLRVNMIIVNMDPGQAMPRIHQRSAYVRNSLQGDVHILRMIIPCRNDDENDNASPIDTRLGLMCGLVKPREGGGAHADMLRTRHTVILGRVGQHYLLLQPMHLPLIEAMLTANYTWLNIHIFDTELERLAIRRRELVRALNDMGMVEPFDVDTLALTVVAPPANPDVALCNSLDWLTNLAVVDAWRTQIIENALPVFRFMLLDIVWPQVMAQVAYARRQQRAALTVMMPSPQMTRLRKDKE